jgi:hypothetical protein
MDSETTPTPNDSLTPAHLATLRVRDASAISPAVIVDGQTGDFDHLPDNPRVIMEWLDEEPLTMRRPLALIDGHAYAAAWMPYRITVTEGLNRDGSVVRYDPPRVTTGHERVIVRDDGVVFGKGADHPLDDAGIDVALPLMLPDGQRWSPPAVRAYRAGQRPDPASVFNRIVAVINRFIDFDSSLAPQDDMAALVACYILATWFLDAFSVIGFLWPNGDRGCGKTQLLITVCRMAFLGEVVQMGGSFASLRDMADYGACLAFDDAEGLGDAQKADPDKRALLLAGNRRGVAIPVKELNHDRTWRVRYVNTCY